MSNESITMRSPCQKCGSTEGSIEVRNGQRCVWCDHCGSWCYNAPREERQQVRSRPDMKPSTRARVLATHSHQCIGCGRSPAIHGVVLHVDHMIPVEAAKRAGCYDALIESEWNMVPLCEECNLGKADDINATSVALMYRVLMIKALPRTAS
jgi:5-methylcytosine-specific restriction endonuclease McrA